MIDTAALRLSIIDKATSGQLSSQLDSDSTIEELIESLPNPTKRRSKLLSQSIPMDEPGILPKHWRWVKLGLLSTYGDAPKKIKPVEIADDCWVLELEDIGNGGHVLAKRYGSDRKPKGDQCVFSKGQILYSKLRPYLKKVIVADEDGVSTPELVAFDVAAGISPEYIRYCLIDTFVDRLIAKRSYGIKMPRIDAAFMANLPIPLPPSEEQIRIVELLDDAMREIHVLEAAQIGFDLDSKLLLKKIIEAGLRGDLTDQHQDDDSVDELIQQITIRKKELVAAKVIRKGKALPPISDDDIPFEIPQNWRWVRTGDIFDVGTGVTPLTSETKYYKNGTIPWIGSSQTVNRYISEAEKYVTEQAMEETTLRLYPTHTLIVALYGEGKTRGQIAELLIPATTNQACAALNSIIYHQCMVDYVYYVYTYNYEALRQKASGTNQSNLNLQKIKETLIPLPPLAEQERIVARINELLDALPA